MTAKSLLAVVILFFVYGYGRQVVVQVRMTSLAPQTGISLTPLFVGFHDGTYDTFDISSPASSELEELAEDGNVFPMIRSLENASNEFFGAEIVVDDPQRASDLVITPGRSGTAQFTIDSNLHQYVSLLSMVVPSNDGFVGNDNPSSYRLFDDNGQFIPLHVQWNGNDVYDAGTEINDEIPANTAFFGQTAQGNGQPENGVVSSHPGLLPPGSGGIVDDNRFTDADFSASGYVVGSVTMEAINDDFTSTSLTTEMDSSVNFPISNSSPGSNSSGAPCMHYLFASNLLLMLFILF